MFLLLLLQDFFANSAEGAKARGEPPPKKPKTAEEQVRPVKPQILHRRRLKPLACRWRGDGSVALERSVPRVAPSCGSPGDLQPH